MSQSTKTPNLKKLAKAVISAKTTADVGSLLAANAARQGENHWRDLGDRPGNAATVQIAASPDSALIERVTNGIDGMLELEAKRHPGSVPTSPRRAAREWFDIPRGGLAELSDKKRRPLAENIRIILEDSGDADRPTVNIVDQGIGQHPADAPRTLLSLNENNKVSTPYLQGAYGQGAAATYRFARYTVIVTRREPSLTDGRDDLVGWTVVWEDPADPAVDKLPVYRYLVDADGEIPVFDPDLLDDPAWHGVRVTHVSYGLRGYKAAYTQPKNGLWALLHSSLFDPVLPVLVGGNRPIDVKAAGKDSTRVVIGNAARLDSPRGPAGGDLFVSYRNSETFDLAKATGRDVGKFAINYWVLQRPPGSTSKTDPTASYIGTDQAVTMTLSGQRQDAESRGWLRNRTELPFLVKNLVVQVDVDDLAPIGKRELFASTRERAVDSELRDQIYAEIVTVLRGDGELRRLEREERDRLLAQSTEQVDEKIRERLRKRIETLLKGKTRKVKRLQPVPEATNSRGSGKSRRDITDDHLANVPTTMRFLRDPITIKRGGATTVWVEIDAKNGYLPGNEDDLTVTFDTALGGKVRDVAKSRLLGGKSQWRLNSAPDTPLGEFKVEAILVTASGVVSASTLIRVIEPPKAKKVRVETQEPDTGPEVKWMRRESWDGLGWDAQTVGEVQVSSGETLILLNRNQRRLEEALDRNKKLTPEQVKTRESRYLLPVACALFEQHEAVKDTDEAPADDYVKGEFERVAEAVLLVIDQDAFNEQAED
jgi:hypothetical protein